LYQTMRCERRSWMSRSPTTRSLSSTTGT
jgi:hypothetical protein